MIKLILIISIFFLAGCSNDDDECLGDASGCNWSGPAEPDHPGITVVGEWIEVDPDTQCGTSFLFAEDGFFETESLNRSTSGLYVVNSFGDRLTFYPTFDNGGVNCRDDQGLASGGTYITALTIIDKNEMILLFPANGGLEDRELNRKRK